MPSINGTRVNRPPHARANQKVSMPYSRPNAIAAQSARAPTTAAVTKRMMATTRIKTRIQALGYQHPTFTVPLRSASSVELIARWANRYCTALRPQRLVLSRVKGLAEN
jgi:hypothetical protein